MPSARPPRGRRPGLSTSREHIVRSARKLFAENGYPNTSLRMVATSAGVDVRLITHYFGSKAGLFVAAVELPFDPDVVFEALTATGRAGLGWRVARFVLLVMAEDDSRATMTGLVRAAASEEEAAAMVRDLLVDRLLLPIARRLGTDRAELRASLMGSQIAGLVFTRHVVGLPELIDTDPDLLIAMIGPVLDHYLNDPLPP